MPFAITIADMAKNESRRRGRPENPDKATEVTLHVDIPAWLKAIVMQSAHKNGRHLKIEVARRLKVAFGMSEEDEQPPEKVNKP